MSLMINFVQIFENGVSITSLTHSKLLGVKASYNFFMHSVYPLIFYHHTVVFTKTFYIGCSKIWFQYVRSVVRNLLGSTEKLS